MRGSKGYTVIEVASSLAVGFVLLGQSVPLYHRMLERSRVDAAALHLTLIRTAQGLYHAHHGNYAASVGDLERMGFLEPSPSRGPAGTRAAFRYAVVSAGPDDFEAVATRTAGGRWSGDMAIGGDGRLSGRITGGPGEVIEAAGGWATP